MPALSYAATCVANTPDPDAMITGAENATACGNWPEISKVNTGAGGIAGQLAYKGHV